MKIDNQDFTIYYSNEWPYVEYEVNEVNELTKYAKENNIKINFVKIDSLEKAKNVPCIFNNWNSYAVTLPDGRRNVVRAKYIAYIILTVILGAVALAISAGISYTKTNSINVDEIMSSLMGTMLSSVIIISLLYPIVFKFGATNGRIILLGISYLISNKIYQRKEF